ncbi:Rrf2 family transcriptional regulator [Sulfuricurvum sp.]|uniref:RrF2 family transcriptional regulator n=1 Tax=Sulfuricurvum sp. TaxID=2025608 RepID=UPI002601BDBB|nr:Rrf2 family transcriptional regulator [Sulfuricurvum sp.]MDD2781055.1 Rrf2 family transcriptional regulator [Sulfuricurvum sp.]
MLMTRASEYALLSLIVLAKAGHPLDVDTLSRELDISKSFLAKILQSLARQGILNSYKGVNGGFELARHSRDITVLEVMEAAEGKSPAVFSCSPSQEDCPSNKALSCGLWPFLNRLQGKVDTFLGTLTLEAILEE